MMTTTDRVEKQILLKAPRSRVWRALTNATEFADWFGMRLDGPFAAGARVNGQVTHRGYEHVRTEMVIERLEPEHRFSYRWHPHAVDAARDYSSEPMTLVEFTLEDRPEGTLLRVTESGFDGIPLDRREAALKGNDAGWAGQVKAIDAWLQAHA